MNTTHIWHELTHASHFQRIKNDRGNFWASNYWSKYAGQIITNELSTGDPYGSKGGQNWQIIALAEGWANYREWKMGGNSPDKDEFQEKYGYMFNALYNIGCSNQTMERCLTAVSIKEFREQLSSHYPSLKNSIENIIIKQGYE